MSWRTSAGVAGLSMLALVATPLTAVAQAGRSVALVLDAPAA